MSKKILELDPAGPIDSGDQLLIVQDGVSKRTSYGALIARFPSAVPVSLVPPTISSSDGTAFKVGSTLTVNNGVVSGFIPEGYSYGWLRNGEPIFGEAAQTYVTTDADAQATITATVQAFNSFGFGLVATSAATPVISPAFAALRTFYIAPDGSDSNPGTVSQPWQTISKVNGVSKLPGDAFLFRGDGTYSGALVANTAGNSTDRIYYSSYGGGRAEISSGSSKGFYALNLAYLTVRDLVFTGPGNTTGTTYGIDFENNQTGSSKLAGPHITNLQVREYGHSGIILRGSNSSHTTGFDNFRIQYCEVYNCTGGVATTTAGIILLGSYGVGINNTNGLIEFCEVYDCTGKAGSSNWCGSGIFLGQTSDTQIRYCLAYRNGINQTQSGGGSYGIWMGDGINNTIEFCTSHSNYGSESGTSDGGAYDLDGGSQNCTVQFCHSYNNDGPGALVYAYPGDGLRANTGNVVRYNIFTNDLVRNTTSEMGEILLRNDDTTAFSCDVYGNTIQDARAIGAALWITRSDGASAMTMKIANNILYSSHINGCAIGIDGSGAGSALTLAGNCYSGRGSVANWFGDKYRTIDGWLSDYTALERVSSAIVATSLDPKFVLPGGALDTDAQLQTGSPLADRGVNLSTALVGTSGGANLVTNGTFDTDLTGWSGFAFNVSGGTASPDSSVQSRVSNKLRLTSTSTDIARSSYTLSGLTVGHTYDVSANYVLGSGGAEAKVRIGSLADTTNGGLAVYDGTALTSGTSTSFSFTATQTTHYVILFSNALSTMVDWDDVVVTAGSSAVLGITPPSADYFGNSISSSTLSIGAHDITPISTADEAEVTCTYTVSSFDADWSDPASTPAVMRDGDYTDSSYWQSLNEGTGPGFGNSPEWIIAHLPTSKTVTKIRVGGLSGSGNEKYSNGANIYVSSDGTTWATAGKVYGVTPGASVDIPIGSRPCSYIKLEKAWDTHEPSTEVKHIGAAEFRVFGY